MKITSITTLFLLLAIMCSAQNLTRDTVKVVSDTLWIQENYFTKNNKLEEIRYCRKYQKYPEMSQEEQFMRGVQPFFQIDSIRLFCYDHNWNLTEEQSLIGNEIIESPLNRHYDGNDFELEKQLLKIEGKIGTYKTLDISLKNNLPQNGYIELKATDEPVKVTRKKLPLNHRTTLNFSIEVQFEPGDNEYIIEVKNSNQYSEIIKIVTVGYNLLESDFTADPEFSEDRIITLEKGSDIFIEVPGNNKLLKIIHKNEKAALPVSKITNKIESKYFDSGFYTLELHNLGTGEVKFCKIKVEGK